MRTLCVWFPEWPLGRRDAPSDRPVVVVSPGSKARVVAANEAALAAGVERGMPRRQAEGICPDGVVLVRDLGEESRRFEPVVAVIEEVIPRVEVVEPGLALVPVEGGLRYYGGEEAIVETLAGKLESGDGWRMSIADGPFAAVWAARTAPPREPRIVADTRTFLATLDIDTLLDEGGDDVESLIATFRWLGVTTLGGLAGLPREAVASRFGAPGIAAHRLAHGEDRLVEPRPIPAELAVESCFEEPLELVEQLAFSARALAARLMNGLRREGVAPHRMLIEVEAEEGTVRSRVWRSADPFTEQALADRVWWQLRAWMEGGGLPGGIVRLRLDPSDLSGEGRQLAFFEDVGARVEAERALARAQALLGPDAVLQAAPRGGRMPAERVAWRRWGEEETVPQEDPDAPWPGTTPSPLPALVPPEPTRLEVEWDAGVPTRIRLGSRWEPVLNWSGPWRLTGRWWRGERTVDRYQLVTSAGAFLCLVGEEGTFLAGVYD